MKKNLFFIDAIGALFSAFFLGIILVQFETIFGMPKVALYPLAAAACVFAVYSFICYFLFKEDPGPYLKIIAIVNLLYCLVTAILVIYFFHKITALGLLYFGLELAIIVTLASIEFKVGATKKSGFA